jgi:hypothetical protein
MIVLTATNEQFNQLNGYVNESSKLLFIKDANGKWVVGLQILKDDNFNKIYDKLNELEQIEYLPLITKVVL